MAVAATDLGVIGIMHRRAADERIDVFLEVTRWTGEVANREPAKCDKLLWADPDHLPPNAAPYERRALAHAPAHVWVDSYGWDEGAAPRADGDEPAAP